MNSSISNSNLKIVTLNAFVCAFLLIPDFYASAINESKYIPDEVSSALFILLLVSACVSKRVFRCIAAILLLLNVVYLHILKTWGAGNLSDRVEVVLEAPGSEAMEYLSAYIGFGDAKILAYVVASMVLMLWTRQISLTRRRSHEFVVVPFVMLLVVACALPGSDLHAHPYSALPLAYGDAQARRELVAQRKVAIERLRGQESNCKENFRNILVVIGESASRAHMGLYGYARRNTPFLESLRPFAFEAIAPTNQTRLSIPLMLTKATVRKFEDFYSSHSVVTDLKACGYETHWISNQGNTGHNDSLNGSIGKEAQYVILRDNSVVSEPDEILIPKLRQALGRNEHRKAFFVHLMGSHFVYWGRYPKHFPTSPIKDVVSEYDESIRYTDFVLSRLFELFPSQDFLFVYVSDHGEVVRNAGPSGQAELHGHGFSPAYRREFEIPLVAWASRTDRLQAVQSLAGKRQINADSFDDLLRYLVGITDEPGVSFERQVLEVSENNIVNFDSLRNWE